MSTANRQPAGRWVLVATIVASSMAFIDSTALNVALDALQKDLHATGLELIWIINAYLLSLAALILFGGALGDHYGRNRIFRIGIIVFTCASFVCGIAPSIGVLILARAVQGIGGALMVPGSLAIISANFPSEQRGQAIGTWSSIGTLTTILAPALGGQLASRGLWRGVFFINVPLALVALFALTKVPETKDDTARKLDYPGTVLITLGLAALTYGAIGIGQANQQAAYDATPIIALIAGVVLLGAFVFVESRSKEPMVPLGLFKQRTFAGTNLMTALLYGALSGVLLFLPLNLIQIQGYGADIAGLTLLPFSIFLIILSPIMGRLVSRYGARLPLTVGPAIVGVGFFLLGQIGVTAGPQDYWTTFLPVIILFGIGMGITVAPLTTAVMAAVPSHEAGIASGVNNAVTRSAQTLATAIFGVVVVIVFTNGLAARTADSNLAPDVRQQVQHSASKLGNTEIPAGVDAQTRDTLKQAIKLSFVDALRLASYIGVALALLSAVASALLVENHLFLADSAAPKTAT